MKYFGKGCIQWFVMFPVALALLPIVLRDYRLRRLGLRPDRWHWADKAMFQMGWCAA